MELKRCASVYIDKRRRGGIIIKCFICRHEFKHWKRFFNHVRKHRNLWKLIMPRSKDCYHKHIAFAEQNKDKTGADLTQDPLFNKMDTVSSSAMLSQSDIMSEDCKANVPSFEIASEVLLDFKVELLNSDMMVDMVTEEDVITNLNKREINSTIDIVSKGSTNSIKAAEDSDACENMSSHQNEGFHSGEQSVIPLLPNSNRCFFLLRHTDPRIILTFIEIIRKHPCQWDSSDPDYVLKEKRDESSEEICKELKKLLNISIMPQLARSSTRFLCRWFEGKYLKDMQRNYRTRLKPGYSKRNESASVLPKYYEKLLEFLPHEHLKTISSCDKCTRTFKTEKQLLTHMHLAHGEEMPYKCRYCPTSFSYQSSLRIHENRHTKNRLWQCEICEYCCTSKTDFQVHMVAHTDVRRYICDLCEAAYKSSTSLKVHQRTHKPPRLECVKCGKKFYENYRLKRHMWIHEAESSAEAAVKINETHICDTNCEETVLK